MIQPFEIEQRENADGFYELTLRGELDLSVAGRLKQRLDDLKAEHANVRLDLSQLSFIDSTGIRVVASARIDAEQNGWCLEVGPEIAASIRRPLQLLGMEEILWSKSSD